KSIVVVLALLACCACAYFFFFQAEDGIRDKLVTGVQTCALPILKAIGRYACWCACRLLSPSRRLAEGPGRVPGRAVRVLMPWRQIGRASCRERVEMSVVAV